MSKDILTKINSEICTGCGKCVAVCPADTLSIENDKAVISGKRSVHCGQCFSVCPVGAINMAGINPVKLQTLGDRQPLQSLFNIMNHRRSCRNYEEKQVSKAILEDLVRMGITAPTGTNSQKWNFTIVPNRASVLAFAQSIGSFYRDLNKKAENPALRLLTKLFYKDVLGKYYRSYYQSIKKGLEQWDESGRERLFHGATACIVVTTSPNASCPKEDALMASQNICLGAEAIGLGTCLIGFAVEAMKRDPKITTLLGIKADETIHAVIAIGYPSVSYPRPSVRKKPLVRYFEK